MAFVLSLLNLEYLYSFHLPRRIIHTFLLLSYRPPFQLYFIYYCYWEKLLFTRIKYFYTNIWLHYTIFAIVCQHYKIITV